MDLKRYQELELIKLYEDDWREDAKRNLLAFTVWTKPDYHIGWHHEAMCEVLDRFVRKEIKRLMVFMPPRHGKSELVSRRLPAYLLGNNPNNQIISTSYSASLATRMNRDVQKIIDSKEYAELFPNVKLGVKEEPGAMKATRTQSFFEISGYSGIYRSAGVGGGIVGMGADYIIIDDPIKNQDEADSQVYREKVWDWYTSTLYTRLEKAGSILITLTRWHEDDLAGRLLAVQGQEGGDTWEIVCFPAIKEDSDNEDDPRELSSALWPEKYSVENLTTIKTSIGSRIWNAQYQQRPAPETGAVVQRSWWKFYNQRPETFDRIIHSWDLTFKDGEHGDWCVGTVWGQIGAQKYLLDLDRRRLAFTAQLIAVESMRTKWKDTRSIFIEDAANGAALVDALKKKIAAIIPVKPQGSKLTRAQAISPQIEAGNVFLPDPTIAPWIHEFIEEWAVFPYGSHDDIVDSTTMALLKLNDRMSFDWQPVSMTKTSTWFR